MKLRTTLKLIGLVIGVLVIGIALGWLDTLGPVNVHMDQPSATQADSDSTTSAPKLPVATHPIETHTGQIAAPQLPTQRPTASTDLLTNWPEQVADIFASNQDNATTAAQLLALFPRLPEEGQAQVAEHLGYLLPDQDYPALAPYLTNSVLPESVLNTLMADALNRPDAVKLPLFLQIARNDQHPMAAEARELLRGFLQQDYGSDWNQWQAGVDRWLQGNRE